MDENDGKVIANEKFSCTPDCYSESFDQAWDALTDYLSLRHSIESDLDAGTPPYEESRYLGWADQGDDLDGYYEPWSLPPGDDEDEYCDPDCIWNDQPESDWDDEPEWEYDWEMAQRDYALRGFEHLDLLPRFVPMKRGI